MEGTKMQHGVLAGVFENEFEDVLLLMSFLVTIAKTTKDKVQAAHNIEGGRWQEDTKV
jgi:hypothetical protein